MKKILILLTGLVFFISCEKDSVTVNVQYRALNGYAETEITWRNANGNMNTETVKFESAADEWVRSFGLAKGEIVYLNGIYHDSLSSVKLQILIDGKVYKEKSSSNDPDKYIIVSGTVPY